MNLNRPFARGIVERKWNYLRRVAVVCKNITGISDRSFSFWIEYVDVHDINGSGRVRKIESELNYFASAGFRRRTDT